MHRSENIALNVQVESITANLRLTISRAPGSRGKTCDEPVAQGASGRGGKIQ